MDLAGKLYQTQVHTNLSEGWQGDKSVNSTLKFLNNLHHFVKNQTRFFRLTWKKIWGSKPSSNLQRKIGDFVDLAGKLDQTGVLAQATQ